MVGWTPHDSVGNSESPRPQPSGGTCSGNLYLTSAIGRFNFDLHSEFLQASEVVPHQAMFLVGSGSRSIFGIGLSALKHLVHSNEDGVSHCHDRPSPTKAWRQPLKTRLEDGTILQRRSPRALCQNAPEPLVPLGAMGAPRLVGASVVSGHTPAQDASCPGVGKGSIE